MDDYFGVHLIYEHTWTKLCVVDEDVRTLEGKQARVGV
jgi:hypothetical protein